MIRDRIVVGLWDVTVSDKLQLDPELMLEKAITYIQQAEATPDQTNQQRPDKSGKTPKKTCGWCGRAPPHVKQPRMLFATSAANVTKVCQSGGTTSEHPFRDGGGTLLGQTLH